MPAGAWILANVAQVIGDAIRMSDTPMNETLNEIGAVLKSRRSIRTFLPTPVAQSHAEYFQLELVRTTDPYRTVAMIA